MADELVTVVIVNYETSAYVRRCVESLRTQDYPHEVVVVDNPSPAEDWRNLELEDVRLVRNETNVGYGMGCNAGAAVASPDSAFICILNPDTILPPATLDRWVARYHELLPDGGVLAPRLVNENGVTQKTTYRFPGFWSYWANHSMPAGLAKSWKKRRKSDERQNGFGPDPQRVDWVMGAAMLISRKTWGQLEGFSPAYFLYAEDTDLCYRVRQFGKPVLYDATVVITHSQGDPAADGRHIAMMRLFAGLKIFLRAHFPPSRRLAVTAAVVLDMIFRLLALAPASLLRPHNVLLRNRLRGSLAVLKLFVTGSLPPLAGWA